MAYEKHTWECGETITADKLNNIEGGVEEALGSSGGGDVIVVDVLTSYADIVNADLTASEVASAIRDGKYVILQNGGKFGNYGAGQIYHLYKWSSNLLDENVFAYFRTTAILVDNDLNYALMVWKIAIVVENGEFVWKNLGSDTAYISKDEP